VRGFEVETNGLLTPALSSFGGGEGEDISSRASGCWRHGRALVTPKRHHREGASVLIIVLWIAIGLVSIALYFANAMTFELRASDNRASGLATDQAIEGAARYISYVLVNFATNGSVPLKTQYSYAAVPVGDARFWLIGRDPSGTPSTEPYFGLIDEGSKLNLNTANTNALSYLPGMTSDFALAITDWRSTNSSGAFALNYAQLGYQEKDASFETVDELRLVYGATMDLLAGDDLNRNGVLDANEKSLTGNGQVNPGLLEYATVYTREPNFQSDGTTLTNVNTASQEDLSALFENAGVANANGLASTIRNYTHPPTGQTRTFSGLLNFCVYCRNQNMSSDDFTKICNDVTTSTSAYIRGRINVNTAGADVLTALLMGAGLDQETASGAAQTLITYRQQNPNSLGSVAWVVDALGTTSPALRALASGDYVTARSFQFTADIAAVGPFGRGYRRVKFVFDTSDGTPKIIYRQDLSRLGWALGEKARETWVAKVTP
jgi:DNA uptake protein ComE-like DNA-binding protein